MLLVEGFNYFDFSWSVSQDSCAEGVTLSSLFNGAARRLLHPMVSHFHLDMSGLHRAASVHTFERQFNTSCACVLEQASNCEPSSKLRVCVPAKVFSCVCAFQYGSSQRACLGASSTCAKDKCSVMQVYNTTRDTCALYTCGESVKRWTSCVPYYQHTPRTELHLTVRLGDSTELANGLVRTKKHSRSRW